MGTQTIAQQLANWVARLDSGQVPPPVRAIAGACLVDTIGVAVGGANESVSRLVRDHVAATYAQGASTVLGPAGGFSAPGAAFANATAAHALDFDDNCYAGVVHGSAVVAPAVLAICEAAGAPGADLLTAFIAGVEVEYALGSALSQSIYDKGWWTTGVLGAIGAAAGAAKALRLTAAQTANAIAFAAAGTGGMRACLGSDAKPILAGRAAEIGVAAAELAARGATGPQSVFEDPRGLARLFNGDRFDGAALTTLGVCWRLQSPGIDVKKYPLCLSGHAAADGVLDILREHGLAEADVATVTCTVPHIVGANLTYGVPMTRQQAQFSLPFAAACMMVFGDITLDHLQTAILADAGLSRAMKKVRMVVAENWQDHIPREATTSGPEAAVVSIWTVDGRKIEHFTGWARGTAARPLTVLELDAKFMVCAGRTLPARAARMLLATIKQVEALADVREIFRGLAQIEPDVVARSAQGIGPIDGNGEHAAMAHERFRKFNTRDTYPEQKLDNDLCQLVKARGTMVFVRGQVGQDLTTAESVGIGDAAAQTDQAMGNIKLLLEEAGGSLEHICRVQVFITDRAYRDPVYQAMGKWLKGVYPVSTGLIVQGLARPEWVVEIEATAVIPDA